MVEVFTESELRAAWDAETRRLTDFMDFQNEMGGIVTTRAPRFLNEEAREDRDPRKKTKAQAQYVAQLTRLQMLLQGNPAYAALYTKTFDALRDAEQAAERALVKLQTALTKTRADMQEMLDRAAKLPNGTRVFKDGGGNVWTEHGQRVRDTDAAAIHWRGDEPGYEPFVAKKERADALTQGLDTIRGKQVDVLGKTREELTDENNPPSPKRLEQMGRELEELQQSMERDLSNRINKDTVSNIASAKSGPVAAIVIPPMH